VKRLLAFFGTCILLMLTSACRIALTATPTPMPTSTITPTVTLTPTATLTPTPTGTATPGLSAFSGPPLIELQMFDLMRGWALTENQVLITNNGGISWAQVPLPSIVYNPVITTAFIDKDIAYFLVPGADNLPGHILATRDGGANWQITETPFSNAQLHFSNDNIGFAMQTLSTVDDVMTVAIYQTLDRGAHWEQVFIHTADQGDTNLPVTGLKTGMAFIDSSQGFIGLRDQTNDVGLYHALDAGRNWEKQELPLPENLSSDYQTTVLPPFFLPQNGANGFLPVDFKVADDTVRVFYRTDDAGITWQQGQAIPTGSAYFFIDAKNGWAWGGQALYITNDGAETWHQSPVGFSRNEYAKIIDFVDAQNGWLLTLDAKNVLRMYRSNDGGSTWTAFH
jgi:photosystem II stability/assembly factor-like uncharacterized protein